MRKIFLLCFLFIVFKISAFSQEESKAIIDTLKKESVFTYLSEPAKNNATLTIEQSIETEIMIEKHIEVGVKNNYIRGYRIRIFSDVGGDARKGGEMIRTKFITLFSDVESYLVYDNPNFKVVVGNYREKSQALKFLMEMKEDFPSAFIIKDLIDPSL